jgi:hypothetical protein
MLKSVSLGSIVKCYDRLGHATVKLCWIILLLLPGVYVAVAPDVSKCYASDSRTLLVALLVKGLERAPIAPSGAVGAGTAGTGTAAGAGASASSGAGASASSGAGSSASTGASLVPPYGHNSCEYEEGKAYVIHRSEQVGT